jgi:hypothetical protein
MPRPEGTRPTFDWYGGEHKEVKVIYKLPRRVNWDALRRAYETPPNNYEELLGIRGIGPATVRALALISELVYGEGSSWKDPVRYSFAFGGKDGVPYPVNRDRMKESTEILVNAMEDAKIGENERIKAIKRLENFISGYQAGLRAL